jgi:hypothetical protein
LVEVGASRSRFGDDMPAQPDTQILDGKGKGLTPVEAQRK